MFKSICQSLLCVAAVLVLSGAAGATTVYYGELDSFTTTTDAHLDLNPATKVYAINLGTTSDQTVNNGVYSLTFKGEWPSGTSIANGDGVGAGTGAYTGVSGTGAAGMNALLSSARTTFLNTWGIDMAVTSGQTYDLQILIAEIADGRTTELGLLRIGSIAMDGTELVHNYECLGNDGAALVYHYTFTATSNTVHLQLAKGDASGWFDNSSLFNAVTLSTVPEPSTAVLFIAGAGGLLVYAWRKRR